MSRTAAEASGILNESEVGCVGLDIDSFKTCIFKLYGDEIKWNTLQSNSIKFMERNHDRRIIENKWSDVIELGKTTYKAWHDEYHRCTNPPINRFWSGKKLARKEKRNESKENKENCKFHNHALSRTQLVLPKPEEHCSKWWKKYNARLPTDITYVGDKAYLLLCPS